MQNSKKRCKTPGTPSEFYAVYGLPSSGGGIRVGPFGDSFPPYQNEVKKEQEAVLYDLVKNPVIGDMPI